MDRREGRREEQHPNAPRIDDRLDRREGRRDGGMGEEGRERRQERRPEMREAADVNQDGTLSPEERAAYQERVQTTHQEIKDSRHALGVEHREEYKALRAKYDTNGDGQLNREEWQAGKEEFKSTFGANVAENIELHEVNQGKRQDLLEPVAPPVTETPPVETP